MLIKSSILYRKSNGDGGYDFSGNYKDYQLIGEAKGQTTQKVDSRDIRRFIGAVSQNAEPTFGVLIMAMRGAYTANAQEEARKWSRDLLLTNIDDMDSDIPRYVFKRKTFMQATIAEEMTGIQDKIDTLGDKIDAVQDSMDRTSPEVNRKFAIIEQKTRENQKKYKNDVDSLKRSMYIGFIITNITYISLFLIKEYCF